MRLNGRSLQFGFFEVGQLDKHRTGFNFSQSHKYMTEMSEQSSAP